MKLCDMYVENILNVVVFIEWRMATRGATVKKYMGLIDKTRDDA